MQQSNYHDVDDDDDSDFDDDDDDIIIYVFFLNKLHYITMNYYQSYKS